MLDYATMIDDEKNGIDSLIEVLLGQSIMLEQLSNCYEASAAADALIMETAADRLNGVSASLQFIADSMRRDSEKAAEVMKLQLV